MRIAYCQKGHRTEVPEWFDSGDPLEAHHRIHFGFDRRCDYCWMLIFQVNPFKAKRTGES